ncbi:MAG: hypothetical protein JST50_15080 [Bacteroidetes bacterium]|jgi:hypothetical protein|nr:hypothetical protein [Bacteroidota bacterium]
MGHITIIDYLLLPLYLWLIFKIAYYFRDKYYPKDHPYRPYFIPALAAKVGGALFVGIFYYYYYGGGDTFNFFYHAEIINSTLWESPSTWYMLITHQVDRSNMIEAKALFDIYWFDDIPSYFTSCLGALIGLFCFTKYLEINAIIAFLSFISSWLMFTVFAEQYPKLLKYLIISIFFLPGLIAWGSGLLKDSFCLIAIDGLIYCSYTMFEKGKFKLWMIVFFAGSIVVLWVIKAYILILLLPIILFKTFLVYRKRLSARYGKSAFYYATLTIVSIGTLYLIKIIVQYMVSAVVVQATLETIKHQKDYLLELSILEDGQPYDLGDFNPTISGILSKFWPAVNVALFRPYLWESHSIIQIINSIESQVTLLATAYLVFSRNILKTIKNILSDPNLIMFLLFTLLFAFIVGVSTYNFGSLSRYKIPCTPFYALSILILLFKDKPEPDTKPVDDNTENLPALPDAIAG